jgi:hypothetical protein
MLYKVSVEIKICKTIIVLVVLYEYATWAATLGVEHKLRVR